MTEFTLEDIALAVVAPLMDRRDWLSLTQRLDPHLIQLYFISFFFKQHYDMKILTFIKNFKVQHTCIFDISLIFFTQNFYQNSLYHKIDDVSH